MCTTYESLMELLGKTLLALQADRLNVNLENLLDECLQYLIDLKIVRVIEEEEQQTKKLTYETTKLGKATVEGLIKENHRQKKLVVFFQEVSN